MSLNGDDDISEQELVDGVSQRSSESAVKKADEQPTSSYVPDIQINEAGGQLFMENAIALLEEKQVCSHQYKPEKDIYINSVSGTGTTTPFVPSSHQTWRSQPLILPDAW